MTHYNNVCEQEGYTDTGAKGFYLLLCTIALGNLLLSPIKVVIVFDVDQTVLILGQLIIMYKSGYWKIYYDY